MRAGRSDIAVPTAFRAGPGNCRPIAALFELPNQQRFHFPGFDVT